MLPALARRLGFERREGRLLIGRRPGRALVDHGLTGGRPPEARAELLDIARLAIVRVVPPDEVAEPVEGQRQEIEVVRYGVAVELLPGVVGECC